MGAETRTGRGSDALRLEIRPSSGWRSIGVVELWSRRELLGFLIWRDLTVRYRQTFFGAAWAILQPLLPMAVIALVIGRIPGIAPRGVPFPLFVLAGLVPWLFTSQAVIAASGSLVNASNLIQKVYFPRLLLPLGAIGGRLLDYVIGVLLLAFATVLTSASASPAILWIGPITLLALVIAVGLGTWLAALNVRYRDVGHVVPFMIQLLLFLSPVFYPASVVPLDLRALYAVNPFVGLIDGFRWAFVGAEEPPILEVAVASIVAIIILAGGVAYFRRVESTLADVI